MRSTHWLSAAAVTLLMTVGTVSAQTKDHTAPEPAPAAQRNAPAERMAPPLLAGQPEIKLETGDAAPGKLTPGHGESAESGAAKHATTGQGAAAGAAKLSADQRAKITAAFKRHPVQPEALTVAITVGTRLPERVHYLAVPAEVITLHPEWRGYLYILVGDEIAIVAPDTHEIVAILAV